MGRDAQGDIPLAGNNPDSLTGPSHSLGVELSTSGPAA
jgi:hypothetical protein